MARRTFFRREIKPSSRGSRATNIPCTSINLRNPFLAIEYENAELHDHFCDDLIRVVS